MRPISSNFSVPEPLLPPAPPAGVHLVFDIFWRLVDAFFPGKYKCVRPYGSYNGHRHLAISDLAEGRFSMSLRNPPLPAPASIDHKQSATFSMNIITIAS
jgi:hypothetical protein